ncbi:MAG: PAS domain S-box protein [Nitrospirota bacterium]
MPDKDKTTKQIVMDWVSQGVFDALGDAVSIQDTDFKVLYQTQSHKKMIGEHIGEYCYKAYQRKDNLCGNCHLAMSFKDGKVHKMEQVRDTDAGIFYYEIISSPLKDNAGKIIAGMEVVKDISKRKQAEKALATSEEKYRLLVNALQEGIWALDTEENTTFVNDRMAEMLGYTVEEMLGKKVFDFMDERGVKLCKEKMEKRKAGVKEQHDFELIKKDGSILYVTMEASPIKDDDGNYIGGVAGVIDITERKQVENALREREKQLAESQRIAHIGSWEHNLTTGKVVWSDELFRLLGLDPGNDPADFKMFFSMIHPNDRPVLKKAIDETVQTGKHFSIDYRFILRDGTTRILHAQAELIPDHTGNNVILSGTVQDITDRREAEEELRKYREYLEHLVKERTDELERQKNTLEDKNIALREVIGQIELEKSKIKENISSNIDELIIPILRKFKATGTGEKHVKLLEHNLKKVTSSFGVILSSKKLKLTPREIDICNMVEKGLTNKEMSDFFNISIQSIEGYRKNIRKKLELSNKKVNLSTYLRSLS